MPKIADNLLAAPLPGRKHKPKTGYSNLVSHVRTTHANYESAMRDATVAATGTLLPWSKETRQYTKLNPISEETLTAIMEAVTNAVENAIGYEMPESFGLIIDGWTHGTEHYRAIYGCYETKTGLQYPLLSLASVVEEPDDHLNAESHLKAIKRFLPFFVNKRLADLLGVPLVGFASHRLNLAVRDFLQPSESDLEEVQQLMRKLRTLNQAVKLRSPVFLSSRTTYRKLAALLASLRGVESVSKGLQVEGFTLLHGRDLFDCLIEIRPSFSKYLAPDADIVHSPEFEQAVVKVLAGEIALLNEDEAAALEPFKLSYMLLVALPPTSNIVERLFSVARAVLRHERHSLSPMMLETILFLKMNAPRWDVATVE
ncbi:hypothetical protein JG687_00017586 [Phytophthora cactorum]|uniref:HAT C-terminal dimerisation domain-containing protein n=1 Tax=Phytophthora cactorum TaxID=29920 RepID=A0A8T1TNX7_9STRA|nr:hypothetical protein JG687_00017586 [Phytophthora cactorum]